MEMAPLEKWHWPIASDLSGLDQLEVGDAHVWDEKMKQRRPVRRRRRRADSCFPVPFDLWDNWLRGDASSRPLSGRPEATVTQESAPFPAQ
ncbi:unnamed protein product [Pleuronectes platessa]|uniref:Uncharacterized protein n=1 Tax=Pleuronectes platessa TaxID=8262 RepID=A0A9N7UYU0_PLEPL|nr:unnamed protein product [Pleuronectes platessa]